jgi:iron complex outermembrane recepter protein
MQHAFSLKQTPRNARMSRLALAVRAAQPALAAACVAALASTGAAAQTTAAPAAPSAEALQSVTITTTARKRKESLQEVPMSMDLITGRDIQDSGVTRFQDLQTSIPGLVITNYESQGNISLRGVGTGDVGLGTDQSVAIHLDGVYQAYGGAGLTRMFDVSAVEVLKGPQGTLYGRNSTAGVVNVISNAPRREFGAQADLSYGSFKTMQAQGMLNVPVSDSTAVRLAFTASGSDGRITNSRNGEKIGPMDDFYGLRLSTRSQFGDTQVDLRVQYIEDKSDPFGANVRMPYAVGGTPATNNFDSAFYLIPTFQTKKDLNVALTVSLPLGDATLKSITGYGRHTGLSRQSADFGTTLDERLLLTIDEPYSQVSQELQLNFSTGKATDWVTGLYLLSFKGEDNRLLDTGPASRFAGYTADARQDAKGSTAALFADVSHPLTSALKVNGGLRYTWEKKEGTAFGLGPFDVNPAVSGSKTWSAVSGRIGLDYALNKQTRLWGNISQGFKSGGVIPSGFAGGGGVCDNGVFGAGCAITIYKPEDLIAYEFGQKTTLPGGAGIINAAVFYYDYKNKVEFYQFDPTNPLSFTFNNAQKATVKGLEVNSDFRLTRSLRWDLAVAFLDTEYTRFVDAAGNNIATGNQLARAPKTTVTTGLSAQGVGLGSLGTARFRVEYAWRDKIFFDIFNNAGGRHTFERSIGLLNASAQLELPGKNWTLSASARNLSNERYIEFARDDLSAAAVAPGRTWQLGASYKF